MCLGMCAYKGVHVLFQSTNATLALKRARFHRRRVSYDEAAVRKDNNAISCCVGIFRKLFVGDKCCVHAFHHAHIAKDCLQERLCVFINTKFGEKRLSVCAVRRGLYGCVRRQDNRRLALNVSLYKRRPHKRLSRVIGAGYKGSQIVAQKTLDQGFKAGVGCLNIVGKPPLYQMCAFRIAGKRRSARTCLSDFNIQRLQCRKRCLGIRLRTTCLSLPYTCLLQSGGILAYFYRQGLGRMTCRFKAGTHIRLARHSLGKRLRRSLYEVFYLGQSRCIHLIFNLRVCYLLFKFYLSKRFFIGN